MDPRVPLARRALERRYGLAIDAVTDHEVLRAIDAAAAGADASYDDAAFLDRLVDELPIDESSLFRNEGLWRWLSKALPQWLDEALEKGRPFRALSIGCSAGQEVFSLAMMIIAELRRRGIPSAAAHRYATVRGVDASAARLAVASSGLLASWSTQRAPAAWVEGHLLPWPADPSRLRVDPAVMAITSFGQRNLLELAAHGDELSGYSLVLCQHVLVYFREETAADILRQLAQPLALGTLLLVSPVEAHLLAQIPELEVLPQVGAARRREPPPPAPRVVVREPAKPARAPQPVAPKRAAARTAPQAEPTAPLLRSPPSTAEIADGYVRSALGHADAHRPTEALAAARAAWFADPKHLVARLLVGRFLLPVDPAQARRVLVELSNDVAKLPPDSALPYALELNTRQLADAVKLLLEEPR